MFVVKKSHHNPILIPYKEHYWEAYASFNMSVLKTGRTFYGVYRAISAEDKLRDPSRISSIGLGRSTDGIHFKNCVQFISPQEKWEKYGCEDPRLTFFEGKFYIFYTALSNYPFNAAGIKVAVAVSKDLKKTTERHLVTPFNAKAMALFPERVNGKVTVIFSMNTDAPPAKIAIAQANEIEELWDPIFWEKWSKNEERYILDPRRTQADHVEVGAVPVKTKEGWLLIYSHIQNYFAGGENLDRVYGIEALLLDQNNPERIVGRTTGPVLVPQEPYELIGHVPDVIFPTGAVLVRDTLSIYYGGADTTTCLASVNLNDLIASMPEQNISVRFSRSTKNPIIEPEPTHAWEARATLNPAAIRIGDTTHILYRALSADNTSVFGYASTKDGENILARDPSPVYRPREDFESKKVPGGNSGCEDPRLTKIGDTIYMCYTAYDGVNPPRVAVTSIKEKDFVAKNWQWAKPRVITPAGFDDKDACIFPEKIGGQYFIVHRVGGEICGDYVDTLDWEHESVDKCIRVLGPRANSWDSAKVGISAPPLKTKHGWLLLYHGISKNHNTYRIGAALLDLKDPTLVLARTTDPVFAPEEQYEKEGIVRNVVFPCGMVEKDKVLYLYYGGADKVVGVATMELDILLKALTRFL
ncbi:MAG: Glycosidase-related protein [Candidatus Nomurabacteria bacterium GW2011_GWB1_47_6]|uniref:Glycosidase-related protein n=1 Tax=Candidatus Nomurabacteria bacterium GW2011_GWB1_47_6 TaxID=1618749 RepID=A0A0G1T0K7_9BACT|nr:MAG: Glycosidase-related protein [Candidatus Nomurabacteria bacterium GW2011_GWB1_47_6]